MAAYGNMAHMSSLTKRVTLSVLLAVFVASSIDARTSDEQAPQFTMTWDNAGRLILGHKIMVALPNGAVVEGKVLSLNSDSLDLQISKTSDKQIQPKGKLAVPRSSLHFLKLLKPQKKWRIILTSVGVGAAIPLWGLSEYAYNEAAGGQPPPLPAAMAIGGSLGYLTGWWLDSHHEVTISIP